MFYKSREIRLLTIFVKIGHPVNSDTEWITACQAMGILAIGVLTVLGAIILTVLCVAVLTKFHHKMAFILACVLALVGAVCIFITVIVWGVKSSDTFISSTDLDLSWSFALSLVGGMFAVAAGVLIGVDITKG